MLILSACGADSDSSSTAGSSDDSADSASFAGDSEDSGDDSGAFDLATDEPTADEPTADNDGVDAASAEAVKSAQDGEGLAVPTALTPSDIGRDIVFRATIGVAVSDVDAAGREAAQIVKSLGGIVFGQTTVREPEPRTVLTFKVLPADFDDALSQLSGVGDLVDQSITADDVTERIVDLESRITTASSSVQRLRALLDGATNIDVVADLERELLNRETTLETLRGQLRTLQDQVSLATITLTITQAGRQTLPAGFDLLTWLGLSEAEACPGTIELETELNDNAVWCIELENTGEVALTDIKLNSSVLRLRENDFTIATGSLESLAPGERLVATYELPVDDGLIRRRDARRGLELDLLATATPADDPDTTFSQGQSSYLIADSPDALPGFGDAFGGGVHTLAVLGSLLLLVLGAVLPFVPFVVLLAWLGIRLTRRAGRSTIEE